MKQFICQHCEFESDRPDTMLSHEKEEHGENVEPTHLHSSLTYGDLLKKLKKMTPEQLEMSVTILDDEDEVIGCQDMYVITEDHDLSDVVDAGTLVLVKN